MIPCIFELNNEGLRVIYGGILVNNILERYKAMFERIKRDARLRNPQFRVKFTRLKLRMKVLELKMTKMRGKLFFLVNGVTVFCDMVWLIANETKRSIRFKKGYFCIIGKGNSENSRAFSRSCFDAKDIKA